MGHDQHTATPNAHHNPFNAFGPWDFGQLRDGADTSATVLDQGSHASTHLGLTTSAASREAMAGYRGTQGTLATLLENPAIQYGAGSLGLVNGLYNMDHGVHELATPGQRGQGLLDTAAGGTGAAAGMAAIWTAAGGTSAACPLLAPAAIATALAASGNERAREWGMFGEDSEHHARSGTDFIADSTSGAYNWAHDGLGGGIVGTLGGGLVGAGAAVGSTILGVGGDILAGAGGLLEDIGSGAMHAMSDFMLMGME